MRLKYWTRALVVSAALGTTLAAHDIITTNLTYTRDISRIFARRCVSCHSASSSLPLSSYAEVRPWAVAIKEQVLSRTMPPWGAVKGFGDLASDGALTQEEIMIIAAWVIGGAPQGDPALLPKQPVTAPATPAAAARESIPIQGHAELNKPLQVVGLRPLPQETVDSARIVAHLPDGRIEPLIWLYRFDPKFSRTFFFRQPLALPAGTIVESSRPLRFVLELSNSASIATSQVR